MSSERKLVAVVKQLQQRVSALEKRLELLDPIQSNKNFDRPDDYELNRQETAVERDQREFSGLIRQTGLVNAPKEEKLRLWNIFKTAGPSDPNFTSLLMTLRDKYDDLVRPSPPTAK